MTTRVLAVVLCCAACAGSDLSTTEQATTVCGVGSTVNGMDVSSYDTVTDWAAAKASGIDFAFVRVSDGTQYPDPMFSTYWPAARAAGMLRGAYQYYRPEEDPIAQADLLLAAAGTPQPGDLPPVLDLEVADGLTPAEVVTSAQQWVDHVTTAIGRPPIIYAGLYSWPTLTGGANLTSSPLWIAQWSTEACPDIPDPWTQWQFWQDTATGSAAGVTGDALDLDVFNGDLDALDGFASGAAAPCGTIPASGGMIDNGDPCFSDGGPAATLRTVTTAGMGGSLLWTHATDDATEQNFAQWNPSFAQAGSYLVEAYTDHAYATSKQAAYQVTAADGPHTITIDQSALDGWQTIGTFEFAAGSGQLIHLGDNTGEAASEMRQLVFDAVRFTPTDGSGSGSGSGSNPEPTDPHDHGGGCATGGGGPALAALVLVLVIRRTRRAR